MIAGHNLRGVCWGLEGSEQPRVSVTEKLLASAGLVLCLTLVAELS
jgi:hypothetical protein